MTDVFSNDDRRLSNYKFFTERFLGSDGVSKSSVSLGSYVVDELIWGFRFNDDQLPVMILLEFLNVLASNIDNPLGCGSEYPVIIKRRRQIRVRELLFNNPFIELVRENKSIKNNNDKWKLWHALMKSNTSSNAILDENIDQYQKQFEDFDAFCDAITLIRGLSYEVNSGKRWTSKFVFPFGIHCLYHDMSIENNGGFSFDYRFFSRGGELLYLMLSRYRKHEELGKLLVDKFFKLQHPIDRLMEILQIEDDICPAVETSTYLPDVEHESYNQIGDDFLTILRRKLPIEEVVQHLLNIIGLNFSLYLLKQSIHQIGVNKSNCDVVAEVISNKRNNKIRKCSIESLDHNNGLATKAINSFIDRITETREWSKLYSTEDKKSFIIDYFHINRTKNELEGFGDEGWKIILDTFKDEVLRRHRSKGSCINAYGRAIGLISSVGTNKLRYIMSDNLIKTLVITIVEGRMPTADFLNEIYRRYRIVIGEDQAQLFIELQQADSGTFAENRKNLEKRLRNLGLLQQLSDSFSYVVNPFFEGEIV